MRDIQFKSEKPKSEWSSLHPKLVEMVTTFDAIAELLGAPPTVVTCIVRDVQQNAKDGGVPTSLHVRRMGERWTRAVDLRNNHYGELERRALANVLHVLALKTKEFDVVTIEHGTGPHFHLEWDERA